MDAPAAPPEEPTSGDRLDVFDLARYSLPAHALLPVVIWALAAAEQQTALQVGFYVIHFGFPAVLLVTYPWWEGQGAAVVGLIVANHAVTFLVGTLLFLAVASAS
ncbi:MAG: hypothetical protein JNK45_12370 [Myxococcales bacterium]|nr:hypothetical protein [Myxococcales bacterium]